jgi:hypothetical protein
MCARTVVAFRRPQEGTNFPFSKFFSASNSCAPLQEVFAGGLSSSRLPALAPGDFLCLAKRPYFLYGGQRPKSQTDTTVVLLCPLTVTTIVVTPNGPTLVAKPLPSTVAIDGFVEDHWPFELAMV